MILVNKVLSKLKLTKNVGKEKHSPKLIFLNKKKLRKLRIIFDIENWLWMSEIGIFWSYDLEQILIRQNIFFFFNQATICCGTWWSILKCDLKYGSEEKGSWFYKCSILLGFIVSKKQERLRSELLSEDKITNLLGFLTQ